MLYTIDLQGMEFHAFHGCYDLEQRVGNRFEVTLSITTELGDIAAHDAVEEAVKEAQETMGVEFVYDVDKEAFREATQPMIEAYEEEYPGVKTLMDTIEKARGEE